MPAPRRRRDDIRFHRAPVVDPRTGRALPPALLASAVLVRQSQLRAVHTVDWQREGWEFYDVVPELHTSCTWWGNNLSRVRLFVGEIDPTGESAPAPVDNPALRGPLDDFFGGPAGHAEMLRRVAVHLQMPGETYLCGADTLEGRHWAVASSDEFESNGSATYLKVADGGERIKLDPETSMVLRLWYPHPRQAWQADSPVRSLRGTLRELQSLSVRLAADIESRLAGAGLLIVPDSATMPAPEETEGVNPLHPDPFVDALIRAMVTPIQDRDSAAAVVPIVARVPAEAAQAFRHITFATPLDEKLIALRDAAIRRLAIGVDQPPESLLGLGESNHWNAFQIDENGLKIHVEPTCVLVCDAITTRYLRPIYARDGLTTDPDRYCVWYDPSDLAQQTDRSDEARELYGQGLISGSAARRENGFPDEDAPSPEEARANLAISLAKANPDLAVALWNLLGVAALGTAPETPIAITSAPAVAPVVAPPGSPGGPGGGGGGAGPPTPGPPPGAAPNGGVPPAAGLDGGWLAAVEMGTLRALEVAGKRLLSNNRPYRGRLEGVPSWRLHEHIPARHSLDLVLDGALAPLREVLPDQPCVHATVDGYVRRLIAAQAPHSRENLAEALNLTGCRPGPGGGDGG